MAIFESCGGLDTVKREMKKIGSRRNMSMTGN